MLQLAAGAMVAGIRDAEAEGRPPEAGAHRRFVARLLPAVESPPRLPPASERDDLEQPVGHTHVVQEDLQTRFVLSPPATTVMRVTPGHVTIRSESSPSRVITQRMGSHEYAP